MKIIAVGRNYAAHAKELGNEVPENPVIFFKPDTAILRENKDFYYPEYSKNIHYECEVIFRICKEGKYIQEEFVPNHIDAIGLGIDFTARDLQDEAKKKGLPWTLAKGFNDSAPISDLLPIEDYPNWQDLHFTCNINNEVRQQGHTANMIYPIKFLVAYISKFITLKKGDLIFTGTPEGVGPVQIGDHIEAWLEDKQLLDFYVR